MEYYPGSRTPNREVDSHTGMHDTTLSGVGSTPSHPPRRGKQGIPIRKPLAIPEGKTLPMDTRLGDVGAAAPP